MLRISLVLLVLALSRTAIADVLVVCPDPFQQTFDQWVRYRQKQGHKVTVISPGRTGFMTRHLIKQAAEKQKYEYLILVGDARANEAGVAECSVPTDYIPAKVNVKFGSENEIATDSNFGDLDDDGFPDVAVARIPADSVSELKHYIGRVIEYETEFDWGHWRRRIQVIGGVGGFGYVEDQAIQIATKKLVTDLIPPDFDVSMTYAGWRSPYYPDPRRFSQTAIERFNEGGLFWVYMGHGQKHSLDEVRTPFSRQKILDSETVQLLKCTNGSPIALMMCCYSGAFDARNDCLAEKMMQQPHGPIATICATRVSMPYAMSVMARNMMKECFDENPDTLGKLFLSSKKALVSKPDPADEYRAALDGLASLLSPSREMLDQERLEHVHMFHLLGDPLLKIKVPDKIEITAQDNVISGKKCQVTANIPVAGRATVELVYRRDRFLFGGLHHKSFPRDPAQLSQLQDSYEKANQKVCWLKTIDVEPGKNEIELDVPGSASGDCFVRVYLETANGHYAGSRAIVVNKSPVQTTARKNSLK